MSAVVCPSCGQRGDEPPGFVRTPYPEAVGFADDDMTMVDAFRCRTCDYVIVVPVGTIEVRKA